MARTIGWCTQVVAALPTTNSMTVAIMIIKEVLTARRLLLVARNDLRLHSQDWPPPAAVFGTCGPRGRAHSPSTGLGRRQSVGQHQEHPTHDGHRTVAGGNRAGRLPGGRRRERHSGSRRPSTPRPQSLPFAGARIINCRVMRTINLVVYEAVWKWQL